MLGKLFKHEFIATARYFLPLFVFAIVLTPVFSLMFRLGMGEHAALLTEIMSIFGISGFVFLMIALFIASSILIVIRFYRTTATSEAYLTFTLPASPGQILCSKLLAGCIWQLLSFCIAITAILAMILISGLTTPAGLFKFISDAANQLLFSADSLDALPAMILYVTTLLIGIPSGILMFYCAIMLGQMFNEHRIIASIAMYMAISTATQILSIFITIPVSMVCIDLDSMMGVNITMLIACSLNLAIGIACYIVTMVIMKKRLNVR